MGDHLNIKKRPVIFIHYGDSHYLKYTLEQAVKCNPGKDVVLIGDGDNEKYKQLGLKHFHFSDYTTGKKFREFKTAFKYLAGKKFIGGESWVRFNFYKMFVLENFTKEKNLDDFWIFDTDVLITEALESHEYKFEVYDYSYHNHLLLPQGLVHSTPFLEKFNHFLIDSFSSESFLANALKEIDFEKNPQFGLTYMYFFKKFENQHSIKLIDYQTIINNETFNPLLFQSHGMELYDIQPFKYPLKKIFFDPDGRVFTRNIKSGAYVKLITINLSWLPEFIIKRIYVQANKFQAKKFKGQKKVKYQQKRLTLMHLNQNEWQKWRRRLKRVYKAFE